ncbi:MAG: amino acid--tRNA ligase-related protein [bacterium]
MQLQSSLHQVLQRKGYQQVVTRCLQAEAGTDPHVEPFHLHYEPAMDQRAEKGELFLHTSPEFDMKRLICRGMKDIYQIGPVFRQGELSEYHTPEFTMAEWYRTGWTWTELMEEVESLVVELLGDSILFKGRTIKLATPFPRVEVIHALQEAGVDTLQWQKLAPPDYAEAFYQAVVEKLQPWLDLKGPLFLTGFPAPLALLAELQDKEPMLSQRFELFIAGVELANGCTELTDPAEHKKRFQEDTAIRKRLGKNPLPFPQKLYDDIKEFGLPPCAGVALGEDRLAMLATGAENIEQVQALPFAD